MCEDKSENISKCSCKSGRMSRFLIPSVLLLLAEKTSHGYELIEKYLKLGLVSGFSDPGSMYRTLNLLESEGYIISKWETNEAGPAKKTYSMTPEGIELLNSWAVDIKERKKSLEVFLKRYNKLYGD
jgi:poly-beta-hydroxybutyrate-responsive repressor